MAHKKGVGSSRNGRESHSKRLGVKKYGGETVIAGNIIIRQRGTQFKPGVGVGLGKDHTIFALVDGTVVFKKKQDDKNYVSVLPTSAVASTAAPKAAVKETAKKVAAPKAETTSGDNLEIIEGIGPAIAKKFNEAGVFTFAQVVEIGVAGCQEILDNAGARYKMHNPETWPQQAQLAAEGKMDELKKLQDELNGGRAE